MCGQLTIIRSYRAELSAYLCCFPHTNSAVLQACKLAGARRITAVLPLLPYARFVNQIYIFQLYKYLLHPALIFLNVCSARIRRVAVANELLT